MFIRDLQNNEYFLEGVVSHDQELNGDERIDIDIHYTDNNAEFLSKQDDLKMWTIIFENKEYKIISSKMTGKGNKYTISVTAILYILDWLNSNRIYQRIDASLTTTEAFNLVFDNSPFTYITVNPAPSESFEGLGDGETRLEVFKTLIERYGYEMNIVGNVVYLQSQVGNDTNFEYRYKVNASNITKETNASDLWTYAKGYADYADDEEEAESKAKIIREYVSPLESVIGGRRHAPPVKDGRIKYASVLDKRLKETVDNSVQISFSADINDMSQHGYDYQHAVVGDRVFLVDERIGLNTEIRVVQISRTINANDELRSMEITFGTQPISDTYSANFNNAVSSINDLLNGRKVLPFAALDIVSKSMVSKIQATTSEIVYDSNGQHFIDKKNNNNIMTMNSSGLLLSTDGGRTAKTAITAEGIVADTITTGALNTNLITVMGGDATNYVEITNNMVNSRGVFTRTWAGVTDTARLNLGIRQGRIMVSNEDNNYNLYMTEKGLSTSMSGAGELTAGTLEFHYQGYNETSRGVRLHSTFGAVALESDYSRIYTIANLTNNIESREYGVYIRPFKNSRPGTNEFNFYVKEAAEGTDTDGALLYGTITSPDAHYGSGIRFSKKLGLNTVYATNPDGDIGSGDFYAKDLYGMLKAKADNQYIGVNASLRVTDMKGYNDGSPNYKDIQCKDIQAGSIRSHEGNFYLGVTATGELRVTNNLLYNGGDIGYKDIRANDIRANAFYGKINPDSSEKYKTNITKWDVNATQMLRDTMFYEYDYKSDLEKGDTQKSHGVIVEREMPQHFTRNNDSVDLYEIVSTVGKALQEQIKRNDELENKIKTLEEIK
ncbi:phage tail protein [Mammaliicoccus vitulinus]|uniref:phage tail protein n=1 Tax=Mammaliicoccus vitulinus TaxID=71237 RepID=UPI002B25DC42|nr:phage tail protein [Mammaliicoccus vitulinus]WQK87020.1 phage tail protein [Mammaliicoccus vitulinus]